MSAYLARASSHVIDLTRYSTGQDALWGLQNQFNLGERGALKVHAFPQTAHHFRPPERVWR